METLFEVTSRDSGSLHLREHDRHYFVATLRGPDLNAEARVATYMSAGFVELFDDLAAHWRGWAGKKEWRSLEGELQLTAECDRLGHVWLTVGLCQGAPAVWTVTLVLLVEAGQLEALARAARTFADSILSAV
jgi:hypothetical protein